jgi:hypothetical protein
MRKLGTGILGIRFGRLEVTTGHEASTKREKSRQKDGVDGGDITGNVGDQRGVVKEIDDGELFAVEIACSDKGR